MRYAIGDVHGCLTTLNAMLLKIDFKPYHDTLYLLGDYVDRGPMSSQTISAIIYMQENGFNIVPLKGNHEDFMLQARDSRGVMDQWMMNGARETLNSYDLNWNRDDWVEKVPYEHWRWLEKLPTMVVIEDYVFCHASLNWYAKDPLTQSNDDYLLWERDNYFKADLVGGRSVINGHTPTPQNAIEVEVTCLQTGPNRVVIDNGCFFKHKGLQDHVGYGSLTCLNLDTKEVLFQENIDPINERKTDAISPN